MQKDTSATTECTNTSDTAPSDRIVEGASLFIQNVSASYGGVVALEQVDLFLPKSSFIAIIGPNGAGKSTLLKIVTGNKRARTGRIEVCGMNIHQARRSAAVGYVPQETDIDWDFPLSVWDVVLSGRYPRSRMEGGIRHLLPPRFIGAHHRAATQVALEDMKIDDLSDRPIGALSGGQKKRVFLARAIAQEPQIMLLDEPLAGVDRRSEALIIERLHRFVSAGVTVIMVTHDLPTVRECADLVVLINRGIAGVGTPEEMLSGEALERGYHALERRTR